jgi:hypothetical protein
MIIPTIQYPLTNDISFKTDSEIIEKCTLNYYENDAQDLDEGQPNDI